MLKPKQLSLAKQWVQGLGSTNHLLGRCFSAQPQSVEDDYVQDQVIVEGRAITRAAILNRPSSLNAINTSMVTRLMRLYESWEENSDVGLVMMKGSGRAFCSGADALNLYHLMNDGEVEEGKSFFRSLYKFVYLMGTYLKPHVAILDGTTMGTGAGISLPGMFRVVTDRTVFCHPETQLGFHPDAGASFYLSRLPGYLGEYLALTGEKLNGAEMIACGLATHYALNARLPLVEERLGKLMTDDSSVIENSLAQYGDLVYPNEESILYKVVVYLLRLMDIPNSLITRSYIKEQNITQLKDAPCLLKRIETIDKCFVHDTVEEIVDALEKEAAESKDEWCASALKRLREASPLSLKVTLESIRGGRFRPLDKCLSREYRISHNFISKTVSNDFSEGIRARLVDKDFVPKWDPPSLKDVTKDMVDCYFSPLSEAEPELELPVALREPYM